MKAFITERNYCRNTFRVIVFFLLQTAVCSVHSCSVAKALEISDLKSHINKKNIQYSRFLGEKKSVHL